MNKLTMRGLLIFATVVFILWCVKGYWSSDPYQALPPSAEYLKRVHDLQSKLEKDRLISTLRVQLSYYKDKLHKCNGNADDDYLIENSLPTIYAITPTYSRELQKAELTRISNTLKLVPNLHWIIIEDSEEKTELVTKLLIKSGLKYTHLNIATPKNWRLKSKEPRWSKPRGVLQRNTALQWMRENLNLDGPDGVIYFLDDDNTYSLEVFDEMRYIKRVGVWPVGLVGGLLVERPRINEKGKVTGWLTVWSPERPFAIDMAGFAINLKHFLQVPDGKFAFEVEKGYQESELLKHFVSSLDELEVKAENCTQVLVWHTRTETPNLIREKALKKAGKKPSDFGLEV